LKQKNFTAPKIFTGGVNILLWNKLNESEKQGSLPGKVITLQSLIFIYAK